MPRRTAPRCLPKSDGPVIDQRTEMNLCWGDCFGFGDLHTIEEFKEAWQLYGDAVMQQWVEAFPGSRPLAAYVVGLVPAPTWQNDPPVLRHPLRKIAGTSVAFDTSFHRTAVEVCHLDELGLLSDEERRLADARLSAPGATHWNRYAYLHRKS